MFLKVSYIETHTVCPGKYIKGKKFLVDMFVDNGHEKTLLENLEAD